MAILRDDARRWTDAELERLERTMAREYAQAAREMRAKQEKALARYAKELEQREKALDDTAEAREAFEAWKRGQVANQTRMGGMADQLAAAAHGVNERANAMVNDHIPRIYAENANRAAFLIDRAVRHDTGFTLVNEDAVRHAMGLQVHDGQLIREVVTGPAEFGPGSFQDVRKRVLDAGKDIRWNRQKFTSAITQGILQGESIPNIVKRTESIFGANEAAAVRAARTATTSAENAGRMRSFDRAAKLGIDMEYEWLAAHDGRTRESHRALDGTRIGPGEVFHARDGDLRYPGDPAGPASEVYNCRCRANGRVVGFDGERGDWADERGEVWTRLPEGTTYEGWKAMREAVGPNGRALTRAESYGNEWSRASGAWWSERAAGAVSGPQFAVDATAQIWQGVAAQAVKPAQELLAQANPSVSGVWSKYERSLTMANPEYRRGAFHREGSGVYMNVANDLANGRRGPLSTFFHEFGHHIDEVAGRDANGGGRMHYLSESYRTADGRTFGDVIRGEVMAKVKARQGEMVSAWKRVEEILGKDMLSDADVREAYGLISKHELLPSYMIPDSHLDSEGVDAMLEHWAFRGAPKPNRESAYKSVAREISAMTDAQKHSLSDMFEGATGGKCSDGWGHGKKYWRDRPTGLEREAFAEFYSAEAVRAGTPETLEVLREWLPESHAAFMDILKGAL